MSEEHEIDPHQFRRVEAVQKFIAMKPRSGSNFVLTRAHLLFFAPLGIDVDHVYYDALSVAEGNNSWPHLINPTFSPALARKAKLAMDMIATLATVTAQNNATVTVLPNGEMKIEVRDPTLSKETGQLQLQLEGDETEPPLEQKIAAAVKVAGTCFVRYCAAAVWLIVATDAPPEAAEEFLFDEPTFLARLDDLFFQPEQAAAPTA